MKEFLQLLDEKYDSLTECLAKVETVNGKLSDAYFEESSEEDAERFQTVLAQESDELDQIEEASSKTKALQRQIARESSAKRKYV